MYTNKIPKKWTLKIQKSKIVSLVLKQSSISAVFQIVRFAGDQKTALTGDPLYRIYRIYILISWVRKLTQMVTKQSHYIKVTQGAIFIEQNMTFGMILGRLASLKKKLGGRKVCYF